MKNPKTILLITSEFPPQPGGIGNHAYNLAKGLDGNSYSVKVLGDRRSADGEEENAFDSRLAFMVNRVKREKLIFKTYYKRLQKAKHLAKNADIVLLSGKFPLWLGAYLRFVFPQKKLFAIIHGSEVQLGSSALRKLTNFSLKKMNGVIAVSSFTLDLVKNLHLQNTKIIPNGFDLGKSISVKKTFVKNKENLRLITVGNVSRRKGQENVIKALPELLAVYPKLEYHIVGIPTLRKEYSALAKDLGVEKHVFFHGKVDETRKIELLQTADIFAMLSQTTKSGDVEGFGIAILEANALGIPAIGSKNCGIEDAIKENYSGFLVDPKNNKEILQAVAEILSHYGSFAEQAEEWSKNFKWPKISKQYVKFIES
ncbi:glycosyltransferase family 4 protein [Haloflavibacter putidus]|uniref:Glycosyltransferase family 4 protein n=1 Tax=Haloflavibacter putidus TaxID=2576776 RepID=A0A507Z9U1_9FLAO|nr:glycosyltransferase family 4 protein [Haloflavibacter putidus]TQD33829.1 glycosyltransferase family 4 protein [Haloflavibacter putidus]